MSFGWERVIRRVIRWKLANGTVDDLLRQGQRRLLSSFQRAARRSRAYRQLLAEAGVDPEEIRTVSDFIRRCPVLDKGNTFRRFPLDCLIADDVKVEDLASVLTSSGHGGGGFAFGLSTRRQYEDQPRLIDIALDLAFDIDRRRTLLINCLPMGVTFQSHSVCIANVSVREDMACAIAGAAGPLFDQIVLCADPLFLKKLCDYSEDIRFDWRRFHLHLIIGEEAFPESFRSYVAGVFGIDPDDPGSGLIGSSMGIGELGLNLFHETRETVAIRRACWREPQLSEKLTGCDPNTTPTPTFLVYNPLRTFVEIITPDEHGIGNLVVTLLDQRAPIPLLRYATGDRMQFLDRQRLSALFPHLSLPNLPLVALHGRSKDLLPNGHHLDSYKEALYRDPVVAHELTGAHRLGVDDGGGLWWKIQARQGAKLSVAELGEALKRHLRPSGAECRVEVLAYEDFPYGRALDYERKFVYFSAASSSAVGIIDNMSADEKREK